MPERHIATRDFVTYPCGCIYACQKASWMDEVVMLQWVEQVLKPFVWRRLGMLFLFFAFGFLQVPHDGFGLNENQSVVCRSIAYPRWMHWPVSACGGSSC